MSTTSTEVGGWFMQVTDYMQDTFWAILSRQNPIGLGKRLARSLPKCQSAFQQQWMNTH